MQCTKEIMKDKTTKLYTRFTREKRFVIKPTAAAQRRQRQAAQLAELKGRLLKEVLAEVDDSELVPAYQRAAGDAAAVAWLTPWPTLFFPALFEEKVEEARRYVARQRMVLQGRATQQVAA